MPLNLAFLNLPEPPSSPAPTSPPPAAWEQLDEAARIAASLAGPAGGEATAVLQLSRRAKLHEQNQ